MRPSGSSKAGSGEASVVDVNFKLKMMKVFLQHLSLSLVSVDTNLWQHVCLMQQKILQQEAVKEVHSRAAKNASARASSSLPATIRMYTAFLCFAFALCLICVC